MNCPLCGAWFETRRGLSSHARAHLRHLGANDPDAKRSPIRRLHGLVGKAPLGRPPACAASLLPSPAPAQQARPTGVGAAGPRGKQQLSAATAVAGTCWASDVELPPLTLCRSPPQAPFPGGRGPPAPSLRDQEWTARLWAPPAQKPGGHRLGQSWPGPHGGGAHLVLPASCLLPSWAGVSALAPPRASSGRASAPPPTLLPHAGPVARAPARWHLGARGADHPSLLLLQPQDPSLHVTSAVSSAASFLRIARACRATHAHTCGRWA